jgi:hypothetical protein
VGKEEAVGNSRPRSPELKKKGFVDLAPVLTKIDAIAEGVRLASIVLLRSSAWLWTGTPTEVAHRSSSPSEELEDGDARTRGRVARGGGGGVSDREAGADRRRVCARRPVDFCNIFFGFLIGLTCGPMSISPKKFCYCHVSADKWALLSNLVSIGFKSMICANCK